MVTGRLVWEMLNVRCWMFKNQPITTFYFLIRRTGNHSFSHSTTQPFKYYNLLPGYMVANKE